MAENESMYWSEEHLVRLGRVIELTAELEFLLRRMLGNLVCPDQADLAHAVFGSMRFKQLASTLTAVVAVPGQPDDLAALDVWARAASKLNDRRDELVHRAPVFFVDESGESGPGMYPARRGQKVERVLDLSNLVSELAQHVHIGNALSFELAVSIHGVLLPAAGAVVEPPGSEQPQPGQ